MLRTYVCEKCGAVVGSKGKNDQVPPFRFISHPGAGQSLANHDVECDGMLCDGDSTTWVDRGPMGPVMTSAQGVRVI